MKFYPLSVPNLIGKEKEYLNKCIDDTFVSTAGSFVEQFTLAVKETTKAKDVFLVNSGTSALHMSLLACGVKPNELVLTTNYSFIATVNSITYCGAQPILIDVKKDSLNIDFDLLNQFISERCDFKNNNLILKENGKKISAFMPVLAMGNSINNDDLVAFKKKTNLPIIIDAAAAIGSKSKDLELGELECDALTLSFNGNKTITSGGGGAILTKLDDIYEKVKYISSTAREAPAYEHKEIGFNNRILNISAAVGMAQIENLDFFLKRKKEIFSKYLQNLSDLDCLRFYIEPDWSESSKWITYMSLIDVSSNKKESFLRKMKLLNIEAREFWHPINLQAQFKNAVNYLNGTAKTIHGELIALPSSTTLSNEDIDFVIKNIRNELR